MPKANYRGHAKKVSRQHAKLGPSTCQKSITVDMPKKVAMDWRLGFLWGRFLYSSSIQRGHMALSPEITYSGLCGQRKIERENCNLTCSSSSTSSSSSSSSDSSNHGRDGGACGGVVVVVVVVVVQQQC